MNYFFKAAAGAMSALILASGAGFTADLNRDCTQAYPIHAAFRPSVQVKPTASV